MAALLEVDEAQVSSSPLIDEKAVREGEHPCGERRGAGRVEPRQHRRQLGEQLLGEVFDVAGLARAPHEVVQRAGVAPQHEVDGVRIARAGALDDAAVELDGRPRIHTHLWVTRTAKKKVPGADSCVS